MTALRAVAAITGNDANDKALVAVGLPVQRLHFDPLSFTIEVDTDAIPPRITVRAPGLASLDERLDIVENDLSDAETDIVNLDTRLNNAEPYAVAGGAWVVPETFVPGSGTTRALVIGEYQRVNVENYGIGDILELVLPAATADNLGRRLMVADLTGSTIGTGFPEIHILTTGGQAIDALTLPHKLDGTFARISFVAVEITTGVYGWSRESETYAP